MAGAPIGNQNAVKSKRWQQAIDRALENRSKAAGIEELDALADKFLDAVAAEGITGFRELGDRMDGKAAQEVTGKIDATLEVTVKQFTLPGES